MKKLLSLLSTLTIGWTAIPAGYAMNPYNLENNSKLSEEWNYGGKSFDWKVNYLTINVGKPKLKDFILVIYDTEAQIKKINSNIEFLWTKIATSEKEKTALEQSKKVLEAQLQMMQQVKEGLQNQIVDVTSNSLEAELELKKLEISKLTKESQEKVSTLEAEVAELKAKLQTSEQEKTNLEASNKELQEKINELTEKAQG